MHMGKPEAAASPNVGLLIALVAIDELRSCIGKGPKSIQLCYVRGMHHMRQPHIRHLRSPLSANTQYCQTNVSELGTQHYGRSRHALQHPLSAKRWRLAGQGGPLGWVMKASDITPLAGNGGVTLTL